MKLNVRLFANLRERAGRDSVDIDLPEGATAADAIKAVFLAPGLEELGDRMPVRLALNREYVGEDAPISPGDELALIPPVSGGAPLIHARISAEPISPDRVSSLVSSPAAGAIVTFQGTTRDVDSLTYESYEEMALERITEILESCVETHGLEGAAAEHRVGSVPLGEPSVIVAVSAAHRPEAFAGAREAIDRIKAEVPIWKQEVEKGEARWVEGALPDAGASR